MELNPDQFGAMRHMVENHDIGVDDDPYFHGTSPEAAEKISKEGFSLKHEKNGRSGGEGVYLHDKEHQTRQYGESTVAVQLDPHLRIHGNPYQDEDAMTMTSQFTQAGGPDGGGEVTDYLPEVMHQFGYHGHRDPDDQSTVVYDPKNVHYLTHFDHKRVRK